MRVVTPKNCDPSVKKAIQLLSSKLDSDASPTFAGITLTDLTASALIGINASNVLESVTIGTGLDYTRPTLSLSDPLVIPGKLTAGSFASPINISGYGFELHYSGNDTDVTGIRSRAQLVTTDTTATAQGALLQTANNDGINAGVLNGALIEAIGKSNANAATITTMRACLVNTEWGDYDTVTNLKTLHVRTHSRNAAGAGSFGTGYGIYIENEAVGGNGQAWDAGIYFKGTNLSAGNKAFTYGIDFTGGTFASEEIKLANNSVIGSDKITLQPTTDSTTFFQVLDADGGIPVFNIDTTNERVGIGGTATLRKFEIFGSNNFAAMRIIGESGTDVIMEVAAHDVQRRAIIGTFSNHPFDFISRNQERLRIHASGGFAFGRTYFLIDPGFNNMIIEGNLGIGESAPETLTEWTSTTPYLTLHNSTHENSDGGGESRIIFKREDGNETETACAQIEGSHDGVIANNQLGKLVLSVNTGAALAGVVEIDSGGNTKIGDAGVTNYIEIEADGTIEFHGAATVWNDANLGVAQLALPVSGQPDEDEFVDEAGGDTGISTWAFAVGERVSGSIEIPHDYKEGSDITFHIHWQGIAVPSGTDNVKWQCTYTVARHEATLDAPTTIVIETAFDTRYEFKLSSCPAITGTNFKMGDQFLFTLERIVAIGDAYAGDALVATVGIHYECNTCGSRQILTK